MRRAIKNSVVVITGASSGIGFATALEFARRGASVVLAARREQPLQDLARQCEEVGGQALVVPTDVREPDAVERLARRAIETFGRIDIWVNNAAVTLFGRIDEAPLEDFRRVIETNLLGYVYGAREAISQFRQQGSGVLINVASIAGKIGQPYTSAYNASKFGIVGLSECLRQELRGAGDIHVCTILPPSIDTPLFQQAANYTGRGIQPMPPVYDARRVARCILKTAQSPQREVTVGGASRLMLLMRSLAPAYAERKMARMVEQKHLTDRPAKPSGGNLFQPMPQYGAQIDGGWRNGSSAANIAVAALGAVALGAGLLALRSAPMSSQNR